MDKTAKIKVKINNYANRKDVINGLVNSGYKVWVEQEFHIPKDSYYVCFELKDLK